MPLAHWGQCRAAFLAKSSSNFDRVIRNQQINSQPRGTFNRGFTACMISFVFVDCSLYFREQTQSVCLNMVVNCYYFIYMVKSSLTPSLRPLFLVVSYSLLLFKSEIKLKISINLNTVVFKRIWNCPVLRVISSRTMCLEWLCQAQQDGLGGVDSNKNPYWQLLQSSTEGGEQM